MCCHLNDLAQPVRVSHAGLQQHRLLWWYAEVLQLLTAHRLHRLYVVDGSEALRPIGLITLTDVLRKVADDDNAYPEATKPSQRKSRQ